MTTYSGPVISNQRSATLGIFRKLLYQGKLQASVNWLFGRQNKIRDFSEVPVLQQQSKIFTGIQDIPVDHIVGSVGRSGDFDGLFRPLKNHLQDRWVNVYMMMERGNTIPIRVYKVKDEYYVEDGNHRVSAARNMGMVYITAEVWECAVIPEIKINCCAAVVKACVKKSVCA